MPFFTLPLALIGLASLPALAAIYWLRRQHRRQVVSSLILWDVPAHARQGGARIEPVRTPWLFLLEAMILALLAMAAAYPWITLGALQRPLIVVLDDSYSMRAGARQRAGDRLEALMRDRQPGTTRLLLAGAQPRWLDAGRAGEIDLTQALAGWRALSAEADLDAALALAREMGGPSTDYLVLTDRAPAQPPDGARWEAFGLPEDNVGFINAARSSSTLGPGRVMLEVASFAGSPARRALTLSDGREAMLDLAPGEVRRLWFDASPGQTLQATLTMDDSTGVDPTAGGPAPDALAIDDQVTLVDPRLPPVRVRLDVQRPSAATPLRRALEAAPLVALADDQPHLLFTDEPASGPHQPETWVVRIVAEPETTPYLGPFVLDRAHPVTDGLTLDQVIWSAGESAAESEVDLRGRPVIAAGNTPLLIERIQPDRSRLLIWRWRPERSTLQQTPDFPSLIWNLASWRQEHLPGLSQANLRLGMTASLRLDEPDGPVRVTDPAGVERAMRPTDGVLHLEADQVGVYRLQAASSAYELAVNPLSAGQSDLRAVATGAWGEWGLEGADGEEPAQRSLRWLALLLAAGLLVAHGRLTMRSSGA